MDARLGEVAVGQGADVAAGLTGWRRPRGAAPLAEIYRTVAVPRFGTDARKLAAFLGPGYLIAVGYMDPGNWATSIAGGSKFGYALLVVALVSNVMAIVLQSLCARLAIASGRDLAQACRDAFPRAVAYPLWALAELAIVATDLAEVIGTAIGLNLLFGIPLELGVLITALDVFLILYLQTLGFRYLEAVIVGMLGVIAACFAVQIALAHPDWGQVIRGFAPTTRIVTDPDMLYLALGIVGATVMPHNLYLHSAIVQTRDYGTSLPEKRQALRFATIDSTMALMFALVINASILILAAAAFHATGRNEVAELGEAYALLSPLLGAAIAPTLFGIALLCCGLNSTVTATLAGQAVMEGFLEIRLPPWVRRLVTRLVAIVPAAVVTIWYGQSGTAKLLILTPGDPEPPALLRRDPAGDVHREQGEDGRARRPEVARRVRRADRGHDRAPEPQAPRRLRLRLRPRHGGKEASTVAVGAVISRAMREAPSGAASPLEQQCRAVGLRLTGQRRLIARVLAEAHDHPDVPELHRRVAARDDRVSLATVYRTVKRFEEAGIIERHAFRNGRGRYEAAPKKHHDHLIDIETGTGDRVPLGGDRAPAGRDRRAARLRARRPPPRTLRRAPPKPKTPRPSRG